MTAFPDTLLSGYAAFAQGRLRDERERYQSLAIAGQSPSVMVIACCDSRCAPEIVFDARPGELFVVRNVANLVPPYQPDARLHSTSAALEFAVQALKVSHIVVMGHGRCGGIAAALDPEAPPLSPGDFIGNWMSLLKPVAAALPPNGVMTPAERQTVLERISIRQSIANLRTFPEIAALEAESRLSLHGAWFDIGSGELWTMDAATGDFSRSQV